MVTRPKTEREEGKKHHGRPQTDKRIEPTRRDASEGQGKLEARERKQRTTTKPNDKETEKDTMENGGLGNTRRSRKRHELN